MNYTPSSPREPAGEIIVNTTTEGYTLLFFHPPLSRSDFDSLPLPEGANRQEDLKPVISHNDITHIQPSERVAGEAVGDYIAGLANYLGGRAIVDMDELRQSM